AVGSHGAEQEVAGVVRLTELHRVAPRGAFIGGPGRRLAERLVRPFFVVDAAEAVEGPLLVGEGALRGFVVSALSVRCIRSWRPFSCGLDGVMRSGRMPSLIHQIARRESPPAATVAKGGPLSVRIARGSPNSQNADSKTGRTRCSSMSVRPSQRSR